MSKPNIGVVIEPVDGTSVVYEPVGRQNANVNQEAAGVLCLMLTITNNGKKPVHLNKVTLTFAGPPAVPTATIPVPANWWPPTGPGVDIGPMATASWNFLRESFENDTVVLPAPAPKSMTLSLFFNGFDSPWTTTRNLAPHQNPVTGHAYLFPAQFDDLKAGEFWGAASNTHATGNSGSQLFAYDMNVVAWDEKLNALSRLHPGKNGDHNEDYRVWGKKLHAMADGKVLQVVHECRNNGTPLANKFNGIKTHDDQLWTDQKNDFWGPYNDAHGGEDVVHAAGGNHFYIQHGDEVALYAHLQKGTLNKKLLTVGAKVTAGDFLGLAGNAGNASEPHLHIHVIKGTAPEIGPLRPLLFREAFAIDQVALTLPDISGPWARLRAQGPPLGPSNAFIWPLGRNPEWHGWQDLGASVHCALAVSSWGAHRLDVFSCGSDGKLTHKWWDGSIWHDWQTLGGTFKGGPAAVSSGPDRIDVFVRGTDDHLGHLWWNGTEWKGWEDLGGHLTSAPAVTSWGPDRLDVFAAGADGNLKHKWWDGSTWHDWQDLGGTFKGAPGAVSWGLHRIDVFVRGMDDHLGHKLWNGSEWSGWEDLGGPINCAPAAASWNPFRLEVFAGGSDGNLMQKSWNGSQWGAWDGIGGVFLDSPAAVSWGPNRVDVFVRGVDNHLGHLWRG